MVYVCRSPANTLSPIRTSQVSVEAEKVSAANPAIFRAEFPSGRVRSIRIEGSSGFLRAVISLVRKTTTSFAPSSRCASKYHHSNVPREPSVRIRPPTA
jgi:hypothetical protein